MALPPFVAPPGQHQFSESRRCSHSHSQSNSPSHTSSAFHLHHPSSSSPPPPPPVLSPAASLTPSPSPSPPPKPLDTADRLRTAEERMSFSSFKEFSPSPVAQTFLNSRVSSYARGPDEAVDNIDDFLDDILDSSSNPFARRRRVFPSPSPHLGHEGRHCHCDCHSFKRWKHVTIYGKVASKSSGDLRKLAREWEHVGPVSRPTPVAEPESYAPGNAPIERLPLEVLGQIIDSFAIDVPPYGITTRNADLISLLLTSRAIHDATLNTLYKRITIPHSIIFRKFLNHIGAHPELGAIVRRLDFSHFNPRVAASTARERAELQNLTDVTLLQCLELTPNVQEFLAQEHIDSDLSFAVLAKLFSGELKRLKGLDFCACSSAKFRDNFTLALTQGPYLPTALPLARLSLHECTILPASVFPMLLSRLPELTHLDVAHTRVNDEIFDAIPRTAKLSHLNLSRCGGISGEAFLKFITHHPAASRGSLVCLNLMSDSKSHELLGPNDLHRLLAVLNQQKNHGLRSLNLKGSRMTEEHVDAIIPLAEHLEELGVGRHLRLKDITKILTAIAPKSPRLKYLDLTDLSVADMDFSTLLSASCPVLTLASDPLEVLELSQDVLKVLQRVEATCKRLGWVIKDQGRRAWLVRDWTAHASGSRRESQIDSGKRSWKLGASFWGMRKFPVAEAEVGGMYGLYMFKR